MGRSDPGSRQACSARGQGSIAALNGNVLREKSGASFTIRANDGFVVAFGPALIAAVADAAPDVCIRFAPKPENVALSSGRAG